MKEEEKEFEGGICPIMSSRHEGTLHFVKCVGPKCQMWVKSYKTVTFRSKGEVSFESCGLVTKI
jgi:hypothetical protein